MFVARVKRMYFQAKELGIAYGSEPGYYT
jgi:hypothetical protein